MKCGSRSCRVMFNYRPISVSATILYVFIRIHVESFNVVYEPCHEETRLRQYVAWVSRVAHAQCSVITEDGEEGFFQDRTHILVYMGSYCVSVCL